METAAIKEKLDASSSPQPEKFEQWCLLELFGHQRIAGLVSEATIGGCAFIRVDVPTAEGQGTLYTRYFGNGAIYAINVTTQEEVMRIVSLVHRKPPTPRVREQRRLTESTDDDDDADDDSNDSEY